MRSYKTEAIIVKRRNFGEADRVLTALTKNYGKIQVRAPGVRKITSRRSSHIELLNLSMLTLYRSSSGKSFPIVTEAQTLEEFSPLKNTLKKIGFAYYICELVDGLCAENQENRRAFSLVKETLYRLSCDSHDVIPIPIKSGEESPGVFVQRMGSLRRFGPRLSSRRSQTSSSDPQDDIKVILESIIIDDFENNLLVVLGFLPELHSLKDKQAFIENILERKLTTKRLLPLFLHNY